MSIQAKLLQSGYLTVETPLLDINKRKSFTNLNLTALLFTLPKDETNNPNFFNTEVEQLFQLWRKDQSIVKDFDFIVNLLRVAKHAFGMDSFKDWLRIQEMGNQTTRVHVDFLKDTFTFLQTGKRDINIETWKNLFTHGDNTKIFDINIDSIFYGDNSHLSTRVNEVITQWISIPNGVSDLMMSLEIIFGKRELWQIG